jgi:D-arabinitol dehydrogenase (NADP+)
MKAVVFEAPNTLKIKEVKTPRPGDNEVVVKVEASGVCASDIHILKGDFIGSDPQLPLQPPILHPPPQLPLQPLLRGQRQG